MEEVVLQRTPNQNQLRIARQAKILSLYSEGLTTEQIAIELNTKNHTIEKELTKAIDKFTRHYSQPTSKHTFARYASFQLNIIKKLSNIHDKFINDKTTTQYSAAISSLKAQSDIYDKVLIKGIELNVISNEPTTTKRLRATPTDLKVELTKQLFTMTALLDEVESPDNRYHPTGLKYKRLRRIRKVKTDSRGNTIGKVADWKERPHYVRPAHKHLIKPLPKEPPQPTKLDKLLNKYKESKS